MSVARRFGRNAAPFSVALIGMKRALWIAAIVVSANCAHAAKNVVIRGEVTRVRVPVVRGATELALRNIQFDVHPGTQFHVYLERASKRVRVGTLSFYVSTKGPTTTSRTFDVSEELRELGAAKAVNVVFEATSGRGEANVSSRTKLTVGEIELRKK